MRTPTAAAVSGLVWALCAALFLVSGSADDATPTDWLTFAGLVGLGGPAIGVGVYRVSRWVYGYRAAIRFAWAVVTVYLATVAFCVLVVLFSAPWMIGDAVGVATIAFLWSLFFPPLWIVHLLAFVTHQWMRALDERAAAS